MSRDVFYTHQPFGQCFIKDGLVEYHIHCDLDNDFENAYRGNTSRDFMKDVYKYLISSFQDSIKDYGKDINYNEDGARQYIWIHINKASSKATIEKIMTALEDKYKQEWSLHKVPKLLTIMHTALTENSKYLANAVSHYQQRHGFSKTQDTLYTLFDCIKPKPIYWLDSDSEDSEDS